MLISNVLPGTLDILARQRCVILVIGSSIPITIPIERILSFNKNTMVIDNADRTIGNNGYIYSDSAADFIGACVLKIEPNGNIFVAENRINEDMVQQAISDRNGFGFHIDSSNNELMNALIMALCEIHNRRMAANGPSMMTSISMFPQQMKSQMMANPSTAQILQNDPNRPIPHRMPFAVQGTNTTPRFVVQPKDQFSRPAAFGPSQAKSNIFPKDPPWSPPENVKNPYIAVQTQVPQSTSEPWVQEPPQTKANPVATVVANPIEEDGDIGPDPKMWITEQALRRKAQESGTIFNPESMNPFSDPHKQARKETANHISGMINAILSSGNTRGALPINDGPVAAFVNGDGDVILSYSDGSISPAIHPEVVGVDEDAVDMVPQDAAKNLPMPIKTLNPFANF